MYFPQTMSSTFLRTSCRGTMRESDECRLTSSRVSGDSSIYGSYMPGSQLLVQSPMTRGIFLFIVAALAAAATASAQDGESAKRMLEPLQAARDPIVKAVKTEESTMRMRSDDVYPESVTCGNIAPERSTQRPPANADARCREAARI